MAMTWQEKSLYAFDNVELIFDGATVGDEYTVLVYGLRPELSLALETHVEPDAQGQIKIRLNLATEQIRKRLRSYESGIASNLVVVNVTHAEHEYRDEVLILNSLNLNTLDDLEDLNEGIKIIGGVVYFWNSTVEEWQVLKIAGEEGAEYVEVN